jgi:hypothetical protein
MSAPKGSVADHWTWCEGKPHETGWHVPERHRRTKAEPENRPTGRGVVRTSTRPVQDTLL